MKLFRRFLVLSILALALTFPVTAFLCGTERWTVKVAQDEHARFLYKNHKISSGKLHPAVNTTIAKLSKFAWPFPGNVKSPKWSWTQRASKAEGQIWRINAFFLKKKDEADQDYHLVLQSGSKKLVAEIPHPDCVEDTPEPLKSMIIKARSDFDAWFEEHKSEGPDFHQKVRVSGIGMFDALGHLRRHAWDETRHRVVDKRP